MYQHYSVSKNVVQMYDCTWPETSLFWNVHRIH